MKKRTVARTALGVLLMMSGLLPGSPAAAVPAVICFGDSITFGTGATPETRWETVLQKLAAGRLRTINEGRSARTLSDAISPRRSGSYENGLQEPLPVDGTPTLVQDVVLRHPEATGIVVLLGVNDLKNNRADGADKAALAQGRAATLLAQIRAVRPNLRILLCCPANIDLQALNAVNRDKKYDRQTHAWIKALAITLAELARREGAAYCSLESVLSPGNTIDGVHPDPHGHAQIARAIWAALERDLPVATTP